MSYFEERNIELYLKNEQTVAQYYYKLEKAFIRSKNEIQRTIESFYARYAKENGLSYYESQMAINSAEIMELREFIEYSLNNIDNKYSKSLELASLRHRISRYEALQMQIDAMLTSLYSKDYEEASIDKLKHIYANTYGMGRFNLDKFRGYGKSFSTIDENSLVKLIQYPFNGASFSSRIWKQKEHLQGAIMESLTTMLVQGSHPSKLSKELADKFKTKRFDAYRLLHTESSYLTNRAIIDSYIDDGVKKYQILATLDSKTCSVCGSKDNKIIELKKSLAEDEKNIVGLDLPPFHPLCRCTTVPYDDELIEDSETRVARDENGEYIDVPASMGYGEWREKFVKKQTKGSNKEKDVSNVENKDVKEYNEEKTYDSIEKSIRSLGFRDVDKNINKIDIDLLDVNIKQLSTLEKTFGIIESSKSNFGIDEKTDAIAYVSRQILNPQNQDLKLSLDYYKTRNMYESIDKLVNAKHFMPALEKNYNVYALTHEYGHMIQNKIVGDELVSLGGFDGFKTRATTYKGKVEAYEKLQIKIKQRHFEEIRSLATKKSKEPNKVIENNLSKYGRTNYSEFFAECFANSQLEAPNELGNAMKEWLKEKGFKI